MTTNGPTQIRADDALKYAAAILKDRTDWACDSIGGAMCAENDHDIELDAIDDTVREILGLAAQYGSRNRYSDGRVVRSSAEIERGFVTSHVWHPDPDAEGAASWRGSLPSGHPDEPSPGVYEVTTTPATQDIHVRVVRLAEGTSR